MGPKKILGKKKFGVKKNLLAKRIWIQEILGQEKFSKKIILSPQKMIGVLDSAPKQCFHPQIPLKVLNGNLTLQLETIPGRVGTGRLGSVQ